MAQPFPGLGHNYFIDFRGFDGSEGFRVQIQFDSATSLRYWNVQKDGSLLGPTTVAITIRPIRDEIYLVSWEEPDAPTAQAVIVHLEDYKTHTVITNYTSAPGQAGGPLSFGQYHGTMVPKPHIP